MIRNWTIANFKSFKDTLSIDLASINVLAGANSSGKSSIIQSILLLKQTLQYGAANRPLSLNGPLLRLGGFDDVRNFEAGGGDLRLSFEFEFESGDLVSYPSAPWARYLNRYYSTPKGEALQSLSLDLAFGERETDGQVISSSLTPNLKQVEIRAGKRSESGAFSENFVSMRRREPPVSEDEDTPFQWWRNDVELDAESEATAFAGKPQAKLAGGMYSYFLPSWVGVNYNAAAQQVMSVCKGIFDRHRSYFSGPGLEDETVSAAVVDVVNEFLAGNGAKKLPAGDEGRILASEIRTRIEPYLGPSLHFDLSNLLTDGSPQQPVSKKPTIEELQESVLSKMLSEAIPEYTIGYEVPPIIAMSKDFIQEYFKLGIRYLGPLRDSPRPVYQVEALESTTDVGYRGEHTAAILDLNSSRRVAFHRPPIESQDQDAEAVLISASGTLHDAVVEWLTYLGVATEVATTDAGVFGNRLQVSTDGVGRLHDLTNVGVGVSQVLPIVVMALLAPKGSFLIFEQPELHLHPKVQARLADFFISLALDGKQMLLETHSEYLIDRFRLRIALSEDDTVRPLINMLFSEKKGANSTLRSIEINEFGAIIDWPKDFFEQSDKDVGRIIRAATKKRKNKPKST